MHWRGVAGVDARSRCLEASPWTSSPQAPHTSTGTGNTFRRRMPWALMATWGTFGRMHGWGVRTFVAGWRPPDLLEPRGPHGDHFLLLQRLQVQCPAPYIIAIITLAEGVGGMGGSFHHPRWPASSSVGWKCLSGRLNIQAVCIPQ